VLELLLPVHAVGSAVDAIEEWWRPTAVNTRNIKDEQGRLYAIEIDMWYAGLRTLAGLSGSVEGVSGVEVRRPFSRSGDKRASFRFQGVDYLVVEPWNDSNEYWIGPANEDVEAPDLSPMAARLRAYRPPVHRKIMGDLLTPNFKSLSGG
jgi:hypothetical protein